MVAKARWSASCGAAHCATQATPASLMPLSVLEATRAAFTASQAVR